MYSSTHKIIQRNQKINEEQRQESYLKSTQLRKQDSRKFEQKGMEEQKQSFSK